MAKKNNIDTNIPLTYRQLQKENAAAYQQAVAESADLAQIEPFRIIQPQEFIYEGPEHSPLQQQGNGDYWGNSMWDNPTATPEEWDAGELNDLRAKNQPLIAKLGSALGNAVTLAGTTFLDGTVGLVYGIGTAIAENRWSGLWDNEWSNGLQEVNRKVQNEIMPYYKTRESQETPWYKQLGSVDFWADGFLKNLGFTVGALYSGGVFTKVLKGLKLLSNASSLGAQLTGATYSAINESRIEANQNAYDSVTNKKRILDQSRAEAINRINNDTSLTETERWNLLEKVDKNYAQSVTQAQEEARRIGNLDLLLNIPILMVDNFYTSGKFYAKGFDTAATNVGRRAVDKGNLFKQAYSKVKNWNRSANDAMERATNPLARRVKKNADGTYDWDKITKKAAIGKGLMTGLREGNEELAQAMAAEFSSNLYSDTPDSYYKAISDPNAEKEALTTYESLAKAFANTYGNADRYEEFAIGALTGLLGAPAFGRTQNADANTYLGRGKFVGLSGGLFGEINSANEINKRGSEHTEWMNKLRNKVQNNKENLMMKKIFNDAMAGWSETDNKFEFKNQEDNETWRSINAFLSTGRRDDLLQMASFDFENMSQEELENIAKMTSPEDYGVNPDTLNRKKNTAGWKDANGNYLTDTEEGSNQMRKALIKKREDFKADIERYDKALSKVRSISNNNVNQNESEVTELAWLLWKSDKFKARVQDLKKEFGNYTKLDQALQKYQEDLQEILERASSDSEEVFSASSIGSDILKAREINNKKTAINDLDYITRLRGILRSISEANEETVPQVNWILSNNVDLLDHANKNDTLRKNLLGNMPKADYESMITALRDTGRLAQAYNNFMDKFNEYSEDPLKQKNNRATIDAARQVESTASEKANKRASIQNLTREQILNLTPEEREEAKNSLYSEGETSAVDKQLKEMFDDVEGSEKIVKSVQKELLKRQKDNNISPEFSDKISDIAEKALLEYSQEELKNADSYSFMAISKNIPLSEEEEATLTDIINTVTKNMSETTGMATPDSEAEKAAEESTGHDPVSKAGEKKVIIKNSKKKNKPTTLADKRAQNRQRTKKSAVEKETKTTEQQKKDINEDIKKKAFAILMVINMEMVGEVSPAQQTSIENATREVITDIIHHYTKDNLKNPKAIIQVLKEDNSYKKLSTALEHTPLLYATVRQIGNQLFGTEAIQAAENAQILEDKENREKAIESEHIDNEEVGDNAPDEEKGGNTQDPPVIAQTSAVAGSWRTDMDEYYNYRKDRKQQVLDMPFHKSDAAKRAYSQKQRKAMETVYDYLKNNHAFQNASKVKKGDKVYFVSDKNLNDELQKSTKDSNASIILMAADSEGKTIIGSLPINLPSDSFYSFSKYGIAELYHRNLKEYNEWLKSKEAGENLFLFKEQTTVNQTMLGHLMFNGQKTKKEDRTLNDLFEVHNEEAEDKFLLAVTVGGVLSTGNATISNMLNPVNSVSGTPYVLVPSGEGTRKLMPVHFQMDRYNSAIQETRLGLFMRDQILQIMQGQDVMTTEGQIALRIALETVFGHNFLVGINEKSQQLIISKVTQTGETQLFYRERIFKNSTVDSIVDSVLNTMAKQNSFAVRINKNLINTKINYRGQNINYNALIGEVAHTDLVFPHTVNDWFTTNPLDSFGKEVATDTTNYSQKETISNPVILYNGKKYTVVGTLIQDDKKNFVNDLSQEERNIILAKNEVAVNNMLSPVSPKALTWYRLSNGALFNNLSGHEEYITDEEEIRERLEELNTSTNTAKVTKDEEEEATTLWSTDSASSETTEADFDEVEREGIAEVLNISNAPTAYGITGNAVKRISDGSVEFSRKALDTDTVTVKLTKEEEKEAINALQNPNKNEQRTLLNALFEKVRLRALEETTKGDYSSIVDTGVRRERKRLKIHHAQTQSKQNTSKVLDEGSQSQNTSALQQQVFEQTKEQSEKIGIPVHNKAEIDAFLKEHGIDDVQAWFDNYYIDIEDKAEWSVVNSNLFGRFGNKSSYGTIARTANYWYLCDYFGEGSFKARAIMQIDGNEDFLNDFEEYVRNKKLTFRSAEDFSQSIREFASRNGQRTDGGINVQIRRADNGNAVLDRGTLDNGTHSNTRRNNGRSTRNTSDITITVKTNFEEINEYQRNTPREKRLTNFYNTYLKLRIRPAVRAKNKQEQLSHKSPKKWTGRTERDILHEILPINTDGIDIDNLSKEELLKRLQDTIDNCNLRSYISPTNLKQALLSIVKGYRQLSEWSASDQMLLKKFLPKQFNSIDGSRSKTVAQRNAYEKHKWYKTIDAQIAAYKKFMYANAAIKYKAETAKDFISSWEGSVEAIKAKVKQEVEYRETYSVADTEVLLSKLRHEAYLDFNRHHDKDITEITNIQNIGQALDYLWNHFPQYRKLVDTLKSIPFYQNLPIKIGDLENAKGNVHFSIFEKGKYYTPTVVLDKSSADAYTLLHEIIHVYTSIGIAGDKKLQKDIEVIANEVKKQLTFGHFTPGSILFDEDVALFGESLDKPSEFLAVFFSNPYFQELLKHLEPLTKETIQKHTLFYDVLNAVKDFFKRIFNLKAESTNLFEQIEPLMESVIDFQTMLHRQGITNLQELRTEIQELRISRPRKFNQKGTEYRSYTIGGTTITLPVEYVSFDELKVGDQIWLDSGPARLERKVAKDVWIARYDSINIVFGPSTDSWKNTVNGKVVRVIRDAGQEEQGELYGFTYNGEIWLDETKMSPNAVIHEYTHLWDNMLINAAPDSNLGKLWKRGKDLMRKTSLWKQIAEDENYGKKWQAQGKTAQEIEDLIASEVHSRFVGEGGEALLMKLAQEKGANGIIDKLKQWILDVWKGLAQTFGVWTQDELDKLTLKDFNHMVLRDFVEGVNPNAVRNTQQETETERTTEHSEKEEIAQSHYPQYIENNQLQKIWDIMTSKQKQRAESLINNGYERVFKGAIERLLIATDNDITSIEEEDIDEILEYFEHPAFRVQDGTQFEKVNIKKEVKWLSKALPQLSNDEHLRIVNGLIRIREKENADYAWGMCNKGIMTISDKAARGTVYHEAFHAVVDLFLSKDEAMQMFSEGAEKYGIELEDKNAYLIVEENLAEDFRRYVQDEEKPFTGFLTKIFRTLKHIIQNWIGNEPFINNLYYRITRGKITNTINDDEEKSDIIENALLNTEENSIQYRRLSDIQKEVTQYYFANIHKKNLTDYQIAQINDDLEAMSEKAGDSVVWHLQPTKYGGWYIAGYNNRSVTSEDYWSPGLHRQGYVRYRQTTPISFADIYDYYKQRMEYDNLPSAQIQALENRNISKKDYDMLTVSEREGLFMCML